MTQDYKATLHLPATEFPMRGDLPKREPQTLARVSRRFGEGVMNGALTARVGVAAMDVCRPLPFAALPRPKVSNLIGRALTGLFQKA